MITLQLTTQKLEAVLAGAVSANQPEVTCTYFDHIPQVTTTIQRRGHKVSTLNNTTDVEIVPAPGLPGHIRNIETIHAHNKDTAATTITIKMDDGGTETILVKQSIAAGESLVYEHSTGWQILTPITPPFIDSTELVRGSVDATKRLRIEVDGFTTGQTRIMTPPDMNFSLLGSVIGFSAGTVMLFRQTSAPTGWTKDTADNDKALRIVSGAVGSGGATAFSSVFGSGKTAGATTLTTSHLPASGLSIPSLSVTVNTSGNVYKENAGGGAVGAGGDGGLGTQTSTGSTGTGTTGNMGTGGSHNHTLSLDLHYVDVISATKD